MLTKTIENTSPKRQRVNESQGAHSLALRACRGAEHGAVQLRIDNPAFAANGFLRLSSTTLLPSHNLRFTDLHKQISIDVKSCDRHVESGFLWINDQVIWSDDLNDRHMRLDQHWVRIQAEVGFGKASQRITSSTVIGHEHIESPA